jgi:hypothetical protein
VKACSYIAVAFALAAVVGQHAIAADRPVIPQKLDVYVGNAVLGACHVRLHERSLTCAQERNGVPDENGLPATPNVEQWRVFRAALDRLHIAQWQPHYPNHGVMDGTQWHIDIVYPDRTFILQGDNNFPDADGKPNSAPYWTATFREFVGALKTLLGSASCFPDDQ